MGAKDLVLDFCKKSFTFGLIALTVSDRYASISPVRGLSMSPTLNPHITSSSKSFKDDYVLVEKWCLERFKFATGDIVVFSSPSNYKERNIKRIAAMPGEWVNRPYSQDQLKVPEGHCWVEGDNPAISMDSRSFGPLNMPQVLAIPTLCEPFTVILLQFCKLCFSMLSKVREIIPLGLIRGRVTHIIWPPQRIGKVDAKLPQEGLSF